MKVFNLRRIPGTCTWMWRTKEGNTGTYYTYSDGTGIMFMPDGDGNRIKVSTCEKFKVCKEIGDTHKKLDKMFAKKEADPSEENPWRF